MSTRKGILLVGGNGSRLHPLTAVVSKQLLPVYDKPMVYYPLTTLMLAGVTEVLLISREPDLNMYRSLLGDGQHWGLRISYATQPRPRGIAEALLIGEEFVKGDPVILVLGDNIFFGSGLTALLRRAAADDEGATVLAYKVRDPREYAVVEIGPEGAVVSLEEKPDNPRSTYAVPGFYCFDGRAVELAKSLRPSTRGELEITDLNRIYLERGSLKALVATRGIAWLDAGTHDGLHKAAGFVQAVQERQGLLVASPDEVSFRMGLIDISGLRRLTETMGESSYRAYLESIVTDFDRGA
jgi:glucose-1-phosphate thymidylyltransferase